uniref:N-acetyltransferase domain-containing protein n=1 Tax=Rhabditophanes sp. KR3021 TaxID=114890 RepID=A0AC35TNX8_9BILA
MFLPRLLPIRTTTVTLTKFSSTEAISVRLSKAKDEKKIHSLIHQDFLKNEPVTNALQMKKSHFKDFFNTLLTSKFSKDHTVVCCNQDDEVIACMIVSLYSDLGEYKQFNNIAEMETVGKKMCLDAAGNKFVALVEKSKEELREFMPNDIHTYLRCEMASVPPEFGGNGLCYRMASEGVALIAKKIPKLQFAFGETTNRYTLSAFKKAGFKVGSKIPYKDYDIATSVNGTDEVCGIYKKLQ